MDDDLLATARARMVALRAALTAPGVAPPRLIETHISWILLTDGDAWKLKKPVRLPFIDMSTLAARVHACGEELRLNRRLAPGLYLSVDEVRLGPGGPVLGGAGELLDVAVHMRRFPDGALWSERVVAGTLTAAEVEAMARRLAQFHAQAPAADPAGDHGSAAAQARTTQGLVEAMDRWWAATAPAARGDFRWPPLRHWLLETQAGLAPWWDGPRREAGRVRECHGDLHLANLLQLDGEPAAFDAIDFDPVLRWIDVLDDAAFPVMDLLAHGAAPLAWRFLDAWLEVSGDHAGLPALRCYLVRRALVRAQVMALMADHRPDAAAMAARYRALAAELAAGAAPRLAITHGLPGSGKSHVALRLVEEAGAVRLRSDVERKRLVGLAPLDGSRERVPDLYGAESTIRTYAHLQALADLALAAGWPVVVDAAFLRRDERRAFEALAQARAVPFAIVACRAPLAVLRQRLRRRQAAGTDPSEADVGVLERLRQVAEPLDRHERAQVIAVRADEAATLEQAARRWLAC